MKQVYLIQDMQQPLSIIAFDGRRGLAAYLKKFDFYRNTICEDNDGIVITGVLRDITEIGVSYARNVYVIIRETVSYGNGDVKLIDYLNELTEGKL